MIDPFIDNRPYGKAKKDEGRYRLLLCGLCASGSGRMDGCWRGRIGHLGRRQTWLGEESNTRRRCPETRGSDKDVSAIDWRRRRRFSLSVLPLVLILLLMIHQHYHHYFHPHLPFNTRRHWKCRRRRHRDNDGRCSCQDENQYTHTRTKSTD